MLPRRAGAKVRSAHKNAGIAIGGLVEDEVLDQFAFFVVRPFVEEERAKPAALDSLEELFRDDGVGVDVGPWQRCHLPGDDGDCFHYFHSLTSTK